jgi:4-hydroxybenzoate polyprenyltransferase
VAITPSTSQRWPVWMELLRWHKPSGRLILLLPAGWSLWLQSNQPRPLLVLLIALGGLAVSGAGCIANDLWDRRIDAAVSRTSQRPLARGAIGIGFAFTLLLFCLLLALLVVLALPAAGRNTCLLLALLALPPILLYPSGKRWFPFPQALLALCWGFAVLIPWAAASGSLAGGWPLWGCWLATLCWTFAFDTVYAMADRQDDRRLGIRSSALSLGGYVVPAVGLTYAAAWLLLCSAALAGHQGFGFGLAAVIALVAGINEMRRLAETEARGKPATAEHFQRQVLIGSLLLLGLILEGLGR